MKNPQITRSTKVCLACLKQGAIIQRGPFRGWYHPTCWAKCEQDRREAKGDTMNDPMPSQIKEAETTKDLRCQNLGNHILGTLPGSCPTCMMAYGELHKTCPRPDKDEYRRAMREAAEECGALEWYEKVAREGKL